MKISIIGTGAIGGYYGALMANAGHDVHFLLRSDYHYVKENGLRVLSQVHVDIYLPQVNAYESAADMPKSDVVLVALKTTQNKEVLPPILEQCVGDRSMVLLVQNGYGMEIDLARQFPSMQIAGAVALIASYKEDHGVVVHQDYNDMDIGSYNLKDLSVLEKFSQYLSEAGAPSSIDDLHYLRWKKLVWNMPFNGLSVALNRTTTEILADPKSLKRSRVIMREVINAAKACDVLLPDHYDEGIVPFTQKMGPYFPSMKLDFDNGRTMELEYLYQRPLLAAREAGFEMEETESLYQELLQASYETI